VTKREQIDTMIKQAVAEFERVDFQFNSAGTAGRRSTFLDIDEDLWDQTFNLNAKLVYSSMQAVLPHMLENGRWRDRQCRQHVTQARPTWILNPLRGG
jgi:3-oxoacyl-[acyl-carrier protein] reductase